MKAYLSTLAALGLDLREKHARYRVRRREATALAPNTALVDVQDGMVPFAAVTTLAEKFGVELNDVLRVVGVAGRTATRRRTTGFLRAEEADRLLRMARVLEEATRVFGGEEKAATWLRATHPMLGDAPAYLLLDSDAGAKSVSDELVRIDFGEFA